uniref:Glucuronosyltransferase n=2 Tax=Panagrolaimus sp. JU765 TaxID=591449 RepID=A0AC34PWG1_9BILA
MKFSQLFLIFLLIGITGGYKILYYIPRFCKSHVNFNGKIADVLAAAGHDVVVYQPIVDETMKETGSHVKTVRYYFKAKNESLKVDGTLGSQQGLVWKNEGLKKMKEMLDEMFNLKYAVCKDVIHDEENLSKLKAENFDLGIAELFESCGYGVFELLGIKKIVVTHSGAVNGGFAWFLGIPSPFSILAHFPQKMTFFQRVQNYIFSLIEMPLFEGLLLKSVSEAVKEKLPNFDVMSVIRNSAMVFVNSDEFVDYITPATPKLVFIGGLGQVKPKPLAPEYQAIFNSSKKGVIFFSFGTFVQTSSMPENIKNAFLEAFEEFPDINFIWKYDNDEDQIAKNLKNVFTSKWLPQNEILEHEKLLAFISHGGMNSVTEAATKGVPMICIPIFGQVKPKPLAPEYQAIFNSSKDGVIFFSFGTFVQTSSMPENIKNAFLEAFEEFPDINFIWKYDNDEDEIAKNLKNVFTAKWLPQNEILEHEKLLAFISHGGMNSVTEAATKGVPMICIPIFGDQPHDAQMMKDRGVAVIVQKDDITKKSIVAAINEILSNQNFKQNAKRLSRMIKAKPMTAEERVVKFTEFVAEFGDSGAFQSAGQHLSFLQLHSLDVIAFLIAVVSFAIFLTFLIVYCLVRKLCSKFIMFTHPKQD